MDSQLLRDLRSSSARQHRGWEAEEGCRYAVDIRRQNRQACERHQVFVDGPLHALPHHARHRVTAGVRHVEP